MYDIANLNDKQKTFCEEYLVDFNGTQAAIRAGYSPDSANEIASALLAKTNIKYYLQQLKDRRALQTFITQERVMLEISRLAFLDTREAFNVDGTLRSIHEMPEHLTAAISGIKTNEIKDKDGNVQGVVKEVKFWDKSKNIEMAAKHLGMFVERIKISADKGEVSDILKDIND